VRDRWSLARARKHAWFDDFELSLPPLRRYLFSDKAVKDALAAPKVDLSLDYVISSESGPAVNPSQLDSYVSEDFSSTDIASEDVASKSTDVSSNTRSSVSSSQEVEELLCLDPNAGTMDITSDATMIAPLGNATHAESTVASTSNVAEQLHVPQALLRRSSRRKTTTKKEVGTARKPVTGCPAVSVPTEEDEEEAVAGQKRRRSERIKEKTTSKKRKFTA
jgi:hypothetical protein